MRRQRPADELPVREDGRAYGRDAVRAANDVSRTDSTLPRADEHEQQESDEETAEHD